MGQPGKSHSTPQLGYTWPWITTDIQKLFWTAGETHKVWKASSGLPESYFLVIREYTLPTPYDSEGINFYLSHSGSQTLGLSQANISQMSCWVYPYSQQRHWNWQMCSRAAGTCVWDICIFRGVFIPLKEHDWESFLWPTWASGSHVKEQNLVDSLEVENFKVKASPKAFHGEEKKSLVIFLKNVQEDNWFTLKILTLVFFFFPWRKCLQERKVHPKMARRGSCFV